MVVTPSIPVAEKGFSGILSACKSYFHSLMMV